MGIEDDLPELPSLEDALRASGLTKRDSRGRFRRGRKSQEPPLSLGDGEEVCRILERKLGSGIIGRRGEHVACEYYSINLDHRFYGMGKKYCVCDLTEKGCPYSNLPSLSELNG